MTLFYFLVGLIVFVVSLIVLFIGVRYGYFDRYSIEDEGELNIIVWLLLICASFWPFFIPAIIAIGLVALIIKFIKGILVPFIKNIKSPKHTTKHSKENKPDYMDMIRKKKY